MPGFIAAVNTSITVPEGATELYYLNYLYGFCASATVFILLHLIFPSAPLDSFVKNSMTSHDAMYASREKWDNLQYESTSAFETGKDNNFGVKVQEDQA